MTTVEGLASAERIYDRAWDTDGTVDVRLPVRVAGLLLEERGWTWPLGEGESVRGWMAPSGERFGEVSDAVRFALTAEDADGLGVGQEGWCPGGVISSHM